LSIKEQLANLTREERIDYLKEEQKRISEKFKSTEKETEIEEWCCKNCQEELLIFGVHGCLGCECKCHGENQNWENHERTLNKAEINRLVLKPKEFIFKNNNLTLKDYPNLKYLEIHGTSLKSIVIKNSPNLETLILNHNQLGYINGLTKLTKLIKLDITGNKIKTLFELKYLTKLKHLYCSKSIT
jgi:Leucine-rich repeat (LRR) protein